MQYPVKLRLLYPVKISLKNECIMDTDNDVLIVGGKRVCRGRRWYGGDKG